MGKLLITDLYTMCQMTEILSSKLIDPQKKDHFEEFSKLLLALIETETMKDAIKKCNDIKKNNQLKWIIEKLLKDGIFEILSFFPLVIDAGQPVIFNSIVKNLEDLLIDKNPKIDTMSIKKSICLMVILNVIDVTCREPAKMLTNYIDESSILLQNNLYSSQTQKDIFIKLILCAEMYCNNILTVELIFNTINPELYNSAVIFNINSKNDIINKRSKENEEKTSNFYSKIIEIVGLLIAVFSIIGVNCFTLSCQNSIDVFNILFINASLIMSIVLVLFLCHNIIHNSGTKQYYVLFFLTFLFFVGTLVAFFLKNNING